MLFNSMMFSTKGLKNVLPTQFTKLHISTATYIYVHFISRNEDPNLTVETGYRSLYFDV